MLPQNPTEANVDWICTFCGSSYDVDYVSAALLEAEQALKRSDDKEDIIQHYER